jgi:hypothetical protein
MAGPSLAKILQRDVGHRLSKWKKINLKKAPLKSLMFAARIDTVAARRLRLETTMTLKWIAARLKMDAWTHVTNRLSQLER